VFCCFNNGWKINRPMVDVWARLLRAVEGSVLWLSRLNDDVAAKIGRELAERGIDPARVIPLAGGYLESADYLARFTQADLFLDTLPYNAHSTASDALWAGLPVVTCRGSTFAGRVAASLLHAIGLPELIADSLDEYEALALKLAGDRVQLTSLRDRLAQNRLSHPLFDTARLARHLEAAYTIMWETWQRGEPPKAFGVDPIER
jgi:predicted O-linked N-acetylglucosamine transferase (SPINDLY family)